MRNVLILPVCFLALCASQGLSIAAGPATGAPAFGSTGALLGALESATRTESFLLAPELNFLNPGTPRIHSWPIVARGGALDSTQVVLLLSILGRATPEHDIEPPAHCGFDPSFGLRFHGGADPLDLLISSDYSRLCLLQRENAGGIYCPDAPELRDSMKALISDLFPNLGKDGGVQ